MERRMKNPAMILGIYPEIQAIIESIYKTGIQTDLLELISLRVAQINQCDLCIGQSILKGENNPILNKKMTNIQSWKKSKLFNEKEEIVLEITENITDLKNKYDSVPENLWTKFEKKFSETEIAGLIMFISLMNMFTRINVSTRQVEPDWG